MKTGILLENLPLLPLCHIMTFLPHSSLLNLSLCSKKLYELIMREWNNNPSLWRHINIPSNLTRSGLYSLKRTLLSNQTKIRLVRSIRISDSGDHLSSFMCNVICSFHTVNRFVIQPKIKSSQIVKILNVFRFGQKCKKCNWTIDRPEYIEMTKLNIRVINCSNSPNT